MEEAAGRLLPRKELGGLPWAEANRGGGRGEEKKKKKHWKKDNSDCQMEIPQ